MTASMTPAANPYSSDESHNQEKDVYLLDGLCWSMRSAISDSFGAVSVGTTVRQRVDVVTHSR